MDPLIIGQRLASYQLHFLKVSPPSKWPLDWERH